MKHPITGDFFFRSLLGIGLACTVLFMSTLRSAESEKKSPMMSGPMMDRCKEMQDHRQKAMAEMKAQDAELVTQVAAMNSAPESEKAALMAALLTRMVQQRAAVHQQQEEMPDEMMEHMMEHAQVGGDSMSKCPVIKGMDRDKNHAGMVSPPIAK